MKWKITYEVKFGGIWEFTVVAETKEKAVSLLKEMISDREKIEIITVQSVF